MQKKAIWILLVVIAAGLLLWGKVLFHPRVDKPTKQNDCLSIRKDMFDLAALRTFLPGKKWKYQYTLDKHNCFVEKHEKPFFPNEYVFEFCAWDTLQLPPIDAFKKGPWKSFSGICYRWYSDSAGVRIPGFGERNPYLILFTDPLRRAPHHNLSVYGKDAKSELFITKLSADTLVIEYGEVIEDEQGNYIDGFKNLFVASQ